MQRLAPVPIIDEISIEAPWPSIGRLRQENSTQPLRAIKKPPPTHLIWAQRSKPIANLIEPCIDLAAMRAAVKLIATAM